MKNRNCWVWISFACCACLVVAAMSWLTRSVIHTEYNRAVAEIRAELQERVRLSLWRMDSLGASILLEENAIPSQLFLAEPETTLPVSARFETPDGVAIRGTGDERSLMLCGEMLPGLVSKSISSHEVKKTLEQSETYENYVAPPQSKIRGGAQMQATANMVEKASRDRWVGEALSKKETTYNAEPPPAADNNQQALRTPADQEVSNPIGDFKPTWYSGSLFLIRRGMTLNSFAQGSLVEEGKLKSILLTEASQLLPAADLIRATDEPDDSFMLASFPFKLVPGSIGATPEAVPRTISISLLAGWLAALVALIAAFFLISNVMKLSERRASFVSAVTHELRTPLTTFRLYSDMLSSGAVREEKKPAYLGVLSREADRLSHLVENVLAFSKIERGSARSTVTEIELNETLESMRERFETRLEAAALSLDLKPSEPIRTMLDTSALEHILFNIIDNAAKYAPNTTPPIVSLEITSRRGKIEISISDHGSGIPVDECKRIFRPFHKSAKEAAETKPGVGLGLALSRRLARSMGGNLSCRTRADSAPGAVFILALPR
jgi:signal transduction histidine kinase